MIIILFLPWNPYIKTGDICITAYLSDNHTCIYCKYLLVYFKKSHILNLPILIFFLGPYENETQIKRWVGLDSIYMITIVTQCTKVCFASFLYGGFITATVENTSKRKLAKCTSVQCTPMSTLGIMKEYTQLSCP